MRETDIIIIGAGCAGTSLALHLESLGFSGNIEINDLRTNFDREQRWCGWGKFPNHLETLVKHSWKKWLVSNERTAIIKSSDQNLYKQIYAPDFFNHFHKKWLKDSARTKLFLGEKINEINQKQNCVEVETGQGKVRARYVFDARNNGSQNSDKLESSDKIYLRQTFLGWKVKFTEPVFDPETVTLMDFKIEQTEGLSFMYVLPYSRTEALIESTCFSEKPLDWHQHILNVQNYAADNFGNDYEILSEESGELPMTTTALDPKISENTYAIGIAGGNARPSSGYAFHRIQRHTRAIAEAVVSGKQIPTNFASRKYNFFDAVFLEALNNKPEKAHNFFIDLFSKVDAESLTRFLLDESKFTDDLKVIRALPKFEFLKSFVKSFVNQIKLPQYVGKKMPKTEFDLRNSVDDITSRPVVRNLSR